MRYYDYNWDLEPERILLDEELNTDKLKWKSGDMFKLVEEDGHKKLVKIDPWEKFVRGFSI